MSKENFWKCTWREVDCQQTKRSETDFSQEGWQTPDGDQH
jgi:hypothetical protein